MIRIIFILLLACTGAIASDPVEEQQKTCSAWKDIARAAMVSRQAGVPLNTMLQLVSDETAIGIFKAAYEYAREDAEVDQQISINRFVDLVSLECAKA